jgi:hypothetical protein
MNAYEMEILAKIRTAEAQREAKRSRAARAARRK